MEVKNEQTSGVIFIHFLIRFDTGVIGGVVKTVTARQSQATISPDLQAQIDAREAEYAAQIETANQQIRLLSEQVQSPTTCECIQ